MDKLRQESGQKLLDAAQEFWEACRQEGQLGSVQWLTGSNGELIIYTRAEYKEQLMRNIMMLSGQVEHFFGESIPAKEVDD